MQQSTTGLTDTFADEEKARPRRPREDTVDSLFQKVDQNPVEPGHHEVDRSAFDTDDICFFASVGRDSVPPLPSPTESQQPNGTCTDEDERGRLRHGNRTGRHRNR
jgi:glucose/arabinose dehydrogenase